MSNNEFPAQPFKKIAISLSGGGYRAASFHLGTLSYLNRLKYEGKPLLENVKLISTVSGGTITGVVYALKKQEGSSFEEFYYFLIGKLRTLDLVKMSLQKLNPGTKWDNIHKRKNLINAFAELYDQALTKGATFKVFNEMKSHLEAVVFNSTEFNKGINFRFRNKNTGFFGNKYIKVSQQYAEEVKLSDAIASSSCFPGGFEPIIWPHDFIHDNAPHLMELRNTTDATGIMDGGIYDNQGIDSILNYKKDNPDPYFDLVIVSDVSSPYMEPFVPATDQVKKGLRSLSLTELIKKVRKINFKINSILIGWIIVFSLLPITFNYSNNIWTGICLGLAFTGIIILVIKAVLIKKVKTLFLKLVDFIHQKIPAFFADKLSKLKIEELSIRRLEPLIMDRINSVAILMSSVFLKIVRRLNYYKLYQNDLYHLRRISNLIMELTEKDYLERMKRKREDNTIIEKLPGIILPGNSYEEEIGPNIKQVAEEAAGFGTTLWFTDQDQLDDKLDKLIATGQFTLCHNLLEYLEKLMFEKGNSYEHLDKKVQTDLAGLHKLCELDWKKFKENPMFLVHEMK
jgi:predicted acylesterase/phospholipase RssA